MTPREISETLAETSSLMQGKLAWDSWSESVTFKTPGGTIQARPALLVAFTPERITRFISDKDKNRLLIVPYLSDSLLDKLDQEKTIMVADLSGNGLIKVPPFTSACQANPTFFPTPDQLFVLMKRTRLRRPWYSWRNKNGKARRKSSTVSKNAVAA